MSATRASTASWLAFVVSLAFAVAFSIGEDLRPTLTETPSLIGHADQAHTALVARNIAHGAGAVSHALWLLRDLPEDQQLVYGENYWSVYVAYYLSLFFRVLKPDLTTVILAASVCKSILGLVCAFVVLRLTRSKLAALGALAMLLLSPSMVRATNGLNDLYMTFAITLAALALAFAAARRRGTLFFLSGMATGIAIGAKPTGMILFGVYAFYLVRERLRPYALRGVALATCGLALGLLPQIAHNVVHHDTATFLPAAQERVQQAGWVRQVTLSHNTGFYSNRPLDVDPDWSLGDQFGRSLLTTRAWLDVMFREGRVVAFALLVPYILAIALTLGWRRLRRDKLDPVSRNVVGISVLMLGAALALTAMVHVETRYLNFLVPFFVLTIALVGARVSPIVPILCAGLLVPAGLHALQERRFEPLPRAYDVIDRTVPSDAILYSANPWELAFHTGRRTISLPHSDWDEFWELAERFDITHVVVIDGDARHAIYDPLWQQNFPPGITKVHAGRRLAIGALNPSAREPGPSQ